MIIQCVGVRILVLALQLLFLPHITVWQLKTFVDLVTAVPTASMTLGDWSLACKLPYRKLM